MASTSLGVLTLNLVAQTAGFISGMNRAERSSERWRQNVTRHVKMVGAVIAAGAAAASYALTGMTREFVNNAIEIQRLAQIANTSTQQFQRFAVGAQAVGIEQDKLSDILKDVNDKFGEFLQLGTGPAVDFFENIAPKVGITAAAFKDLSGADALGLYVKSLQDANLTQQEMTFYMEALGNDSTALLPLLKDNAKALTAIANAAEAVGVIVSDETLAAANALDAELSLLEMQSDGLTNQFLSGFIPSLRDAAAGLLFVRNGSAAAVEGGKVLGNMLRWLLKIVAGAYSAFSILGKSIGAVMATINTFYNAVDDALTVAKEQAKGVLSRVGIDIEINTESLKRAKAGLRHFPNQLSAIGEGYREELNKTVESYTAFTETVEGSNAALEGSVQAYIDARKALTELNHTKSSYTGKKEEEKKKKSSTKHHAQSKKHEAAAQKALNDLLSKYSSLNKELMTEEERRNSVLKERITLLDSMEKFLNNAALRAKAGISEKELLALRQEIAKNRNRALNEAKGLRSLKELLGDYSSLNRELMTDSERYNETLKERLKLLEEVKKQLADPIRRAEAGVSDSMLAALESEIEKNRSRVIAEAMKGIDKSGFEGAIQKMTENMGTLNDVVEDGTLSVFSKASDALADFAATGKLKMRSFTISVLQDLSKMFMKFAAIKAVTGLFGGYLGAGTSVGGISLQAKGGGWSNGLQFFARGGVVNRATAFGMAHGGIGVMGEAGPEAIMPLSRGRDGKLGVKFNGEAAGGGQQIVINHTVIINNEDGSSEIRSDAPAELKRMLDDHYNQKIAQSLRPGGQLYHAFKKR